MERKINLKIVKNWFAEKNKKIHQVRIYYDANNFAIKEQMKKKNDKQCNNSNVKHIECNNTNNK